MKMSRSDSALSCQYKKVSAFSTSGTKCFFLHLEQQRFFLHMSCIFGVWKHKIYGPLVLCTCYFDTSNKNITKLSGHGHAPLSNL